MKGVHKGAGQCFWGVCWEEGAFARAWGIIFGAFAGSKRRSQERGALFLGRSLGQETRV